MTEKMTEAEKLERIRQLRVARGVAKRQLTLLERFLSNLSPDTSIYVIEARSETLDTIRKDFDSAQKELEQLDPSESEEPPSNELTEREDFENRFIQVKARFQQMMRENHESSFNPNHNSTVVDIVTDLPKVELPDFHGEYDEYHSFMDIFDSRVNKPGLRSITDVRRLEYLKGACKGRAYEVIRHLKITNENYTVARDLLKKRFCNPRLTFHQCIDKMWNVPRAISAETLRNVSDIIDSQLKVLEHLGTKEQVVDGILIHLTVTKFDSITKAKWEEHLASSKQIPSWETLTTFLDKRCTAWEALEAHKCAVKPIALSGPSRVFDSPKKNYIASTTKKCIMCKQNCDNLINCSKFLELPPRRRSNLAKDWQLCFCCLQPRHENPCASDNCEYCGRTHHTMLHYGRVPTNNEVPYDTSSTTRSTVSVACKSLTACKQTEIKNELLWKNFDSSYCFLATALVLVKNSFGEYIPMRVLLDGAAQSSFVTAKAAKLLGLPTFPTRIELAGVHGDVKTLRKAIKLQIKASATGAESEFLAIVNPYYRDSHPSKFIDTSSWCIPNNIKLADTNFNHPQEIDILINAHLTYEWQAVGQIKLGDDMPILQKTMLGWVVVGNYDNDSLRTPPFSINLVSTGLIQDVMERFWSVEDMHLSQKAMTSEEAECEKHFVENVTRRTDGRFVVKLPFKCNPEKLGHSYSMAKTRFIGLRRKFIQDNHLHTEYKKFMNEYIQLGHMKPSHKLTKLSYYIPHFNVLNPTSTTTNFRVVFDASAATNNGLSLNDVLMVGPTIQRELFVHLLTFRCKPVAITGDISKMYRQICVADEDQKWQTILWSDNSNIQDYELTTVTYGTASASFLATRVLKELADQEIEMLKGARAIKDHMYVDDLIATADTNEEAIQIFQEVKAILNKAQMPIRKFCSNSREVLAAIPEDLHGTKLKVGEKDLIKALGMLWDPTSDEFKYYHDETTRKITKRDILSEIGSLFDPLGLVAPVTVLGKMFMQQLWASKVAWDESLPQALATSWEKMRAQLVDIQKISIPRIVISTAPKIVMHGFADASKKAYAAVLYISSIENDGTVTTRLLCCKTKVAPLKVVTLPRLELLGALLLARLYKKVSPWLPFQINHTFLWVDASIALTWIRGSPHEYTDFVATRVTEIQNTTQDCQWRHVPTDQNPADIASRGMLPTPLSESHLWFNGPEFVKNDSSTWPNRFEKVACMPEIATVKKILSVSQGAKDLVHQSKYHSWHPMQRVFGYVARFIHNSRQKLRDREATTWKVGDPLPKPLSPIEREKGLKTAVKIIQHAHFASFIDLLNDDGRKNKKNPLLRLHAFLDDENIIRVGGRLANATDITDETKYPMILPADHPITRSLFIHSHYELMHAAPKALMGHVYRRFWPLQGKVIANQTVRDCLRCQWIKPIPAEQIMGPLPAFRASKVYRAFTCTGVDLFEPLWISQPGRGKKRLRAYGVIFVCFTTKAVHIELVDDLSTSGFLGALKRFIGRRGCPTQMYSDNGRNFLGTRNLLYDWQQKYEQDAVVEWCATNGIEWTFIPPRTPHQAGLMEAAVKSAKFHIIRAIGETSLYRSEMETILVSVEAILNSRPIVPVSLNPLDGAPLTPAHFLIGEPLKELPEPNLRDHNINTIERFKRLIAIKQNFWDRWSKEYRHTLLNRNKWMFEKPNVLEGSIVLLIDRNTKPLKWQWGKVTTTFQGQDDKVRKVLVKSPKGTYERGITEICPLPFKESNSN